MFELNYQQQTLTECSANRHWLTQEAQAQV